MRRRRYHSVLPSGVRNSRRLRACPPSKAANNLAHTNVKTRMLIKKFVRLKYLFMVLGCLGAISMWPVRGQALPGESPALAPTGIPTPNPNTDAGLQALPQTPDLVPKPTPAENVAPTPRPIGSNPSDEPGDPRRSTNDNYWLDSYPLNDLFQYLARTAGLQYF
jgi:hypothetical protein